MKHAGLEVVFHRTVRVADGRTPSNLPPPLGRARVRPVKQFRQACPAAWEDSGVFIPLHDVEAMWMSFHAEGGPVAVLVGAVGINAVSGQKLGTMLEPGGYLVCPPQPWLDGWKGEDGTVYQFIATPFQGGAGLSVGEQILGADSKSGGIGLAVFEPTAPIAAPIPKPSEGWSFSPVDDQFQYHTGGSAFVSCAVSASSMTGVYARSSFAEMGLGKGGRIWQKVYDDPYGIATWKTAPTAAMAVYLVGAEEYRQITGETIPAPVGHEAYPGPWFGLDDASLKDAPGTGTFTGLKTVFAGDTSNLAVSAIPPE